MFVSQKYRRTLIFLQCQRSPAPISVDTLVVVRMYAACRGHVLNIYKVCMQSSRHLECILTTVGPRYGLAEMYLVAACWPSRMVVVRKVDLHAVWKSAHTLCNVCAGFHVMYLHEIHEGVEKILIHALFVCVRFSKGGGGGGGWGETTSFRF